MHQLAWHAVVLSLAPVVPAARADYVFEERLHTFPDAVEISTQFGTFSDLQINGDVINATGFLFTVANTSWGDGAYSSFEQQPDVSFAPGGVLIPEAAAAIAEAQPFGMYVFATQLLAGSGAVTSAPAGFEAHVQTNGGGSPGSAVSVYFAIDLANPDGLLFDQQATGIDPVFTNPRTGSIQFFISTATTDVLDNLLFEIDGLPAVYVDAVFAWERDGATATAFSAPGLVFDGKAMVPRGGIVLVPAPATIAAVVVPFAARRRRRPA